MQSESVMNEGLSSTTLNESIVVACPEGAAAQLMLLFHGVGGTPQDMAPLGERLAAAYPQACVVSVCAPLPSDQGSGYQWYSLSGATEENRPARIAEAMPAFLQTVRHWQQATDTDAERTALVGFSQGAIMALESTHEAPRCAARVASLAGRFVRLPEPVDDAVTLYLLHGKSDPVIPYGYTVTAAEYIVAREGDVTADVLPFVDHEITAEMIEVLVQRLQAHVPRRLWQEAMRLQASAESSSGN
jgi:phospholipase/carboxylesterase